MVEVAKKSELMKKNADELKAMAKKAGVAEFDEMNKEELAAAIVSKQTAAVSEAEMDAASRSTGEVLAAQPKRKVRLYQVPKNSTEKSLPDETVCINGYVYQIKRGVEVEVPEAVYEVLEQAGRI